MIDWFNNDLSDYIDKKEKIIIDTRKNDKICHLLGIIWGIIFTLFAALYMAVLSGIISVVFVDNVEPNLFITFIVFILVFICTLSPFIRLEYNSQLSTRYILTNNGIYKMTRFGCKFVAYNQITEVSVSITGLNRKFGAGSIRIWTANGNVVGYVSGGNGTIYSMGGLTIESVDNYKKIREIIIKNRKK